MEGLCGKKVCARLCSRVEHCSAGQRRVKNLWGRRRIAHEKPRQLPLFDSTRTKEPFPTTLTLGYNLR